MRWRHASSNLRAVPRTPPKPPLPLLSPRVVLAPLSGTGFGIVIGVYLAICLLAFLLNPRDVNGRTRALGCSVLLVIFFGLLLVAFAAWAADNIF